MKIVLAVIILLPIYKQFFIFHEWHSPNRCEKTRVRTTQIFKALARSSSWNWLKRNEVSNFGHYIKWAYHAKMFLKRRVIFFVIHQEGKLASFLKLSPAFIRLTCRVPMSSTKARPFNEMSDNLIIFIDTLHTIVQSSFQSSILDRRETRTHVHLPQILIASSWTTSSLNLSEFFC